GNKPHETHPAMTLQLRTKARLFDLHCSVGLTDWDMDKELKLATTTDQFYHGDPFCFLCGVGRHCSYEKLNDQYVVQRPSARASRRKDEFIWYDKMSDTFVKPNLWLLVNPDIACPIQYRENASDLRPLCEAADEIHTAVLDPAETHHQLPSDLHMFVSHNAPLQEELLQLVSNENVSCGLAKNRHKGRTTKARDSKTLKPGCWPRPPVNYCILIALALKSSHTGSLKVQQIYHFTRRLQMAGRTPSGTTCAFNSSFRKTCNQLYRDGKRKSCFWHLTLDGHRRLRDEIRTLTGESFEQLERSMSHPGPFLLLFLLSSTASGSVLSKYYQYIYTYSTWQDAQSYCRRFYGTSCEEINFFICHKPEGGHHLDYIFIPEPKNWSEAQQYCRTKYRDLATIKDDSDMNEAVKSQDFPVWTGLHRDWETWKWSTGVSEYRDWASNEPGSNGDCVSILSVHKKMTTQNCSALFPFICISDNLVLVKENKTWEEALEHCRNLEPTHSVYDLVSVEPVDHEYMIQKIMEANTEKVWTGLRFLAGHWVWVNGAPVLYPDLPPCPIEEQRCGVLSQNDKGSIETTDCLERRNFLCYRSYK
ncbi:hypothetical protein L3Q82_008526, partial [Scortum barcoo]